MGHAKRKHWAAAMLAAALLLLLMPGRGGPAWSRAAGAAPCTMLAAPSLQLAGMRLSLKIEFDTPSGCALARALWPVVAPFTSASGE